MDTVSGTISSPHNSLLIAATNIQQRERLPSPLSMRDSTLSDVDRVFVEVLRRLVSLPEKTVITRWACSFPDTKPHEVKSLPTGQRAKTVQEM